MNFKIFLIKIGLHKLKPKLVQKWAKRKNFNLIEYAAKNGDFWCRREAAKVLSNYEKEKCFPLLKVLLHDKVFTVAEFAIESLNKFDLPHETVDDIKSVLSQWEEREKMIKENWEKPVKSNQSLYIDKTQMVRLQELKNLLGKQKGSMSIG